MTADMVNGAFEALGAIFITRNCMALFRDKEVKGVSVMTTAFFFAWGFWNVYFYPALGQWWSLAGGVLIATANCTWLAMAVCYRRRTFA